MKNTDLHIEILLQECETEIMKILVLENKYKIAVPLFGAAYMLHQIKAQQFYTDLSAIIIILVNFCLFVLLLYVPSQDRTVSSPNHNFLGKLEQAVNRYFACN